MPRKMTAQCSPKNANPTYIKYLRTLVANSIRIVFNGIIGSDIECKHDRKCRMWIGWWFAYKSIHSLQMVEAISGANLILRRWNRKEGEIKNENARTLIAKWQRKYQMKASHRLHAFGFQWVPSKHRCRRVLLQCQKKNHGPIIIIVSCLPLMSLLRRRRFHRYQ